DSWCWLPLFRRHSLAGCKFPRFFSEVGGIIGKFRRPGSIIIEVPGVIAQVPLIVVEFRCAAVLAAGDAARSVRPLEAAGRIRRNGRKSRLATPCMRICRGGQPEGGRDQYPSHERSPQR